jgi:hypothetical protein
LEQGLRPNQSTTASWSSQNSGKKGFGQAALTGPQRRFSPNHCRHKIPPTQWRNATLEGGGLTFGAKSLTKCRRHCNELNGLSHPVAGPRSWHSEQICQAWTFKSPKIDIVINALLLPMIPSSLAGQSSTLVDIIRQAVDRVFNRAGDTAIEPELRLA